MAKGKHAAALFEVIHSGKSAPNESLLKTPLWWFKRRPAGKPNPATVDSSSESVTDPTENVDLPSESAPIVVPSPRADPTTPTRQFSFNFTPRSMAVAGAALVVVLGIAYLIGKKMSAGPTLSYASQTTEQLRAGKPHPDVLNVSAPTRGGASPTAHEPDSGTSARGPETNPDNVEPSGNSPAAQAPGKRDLNLNYVIIQSYPDEPSATEARDALIKAGVGCSVEQKLPRFSTKWFTVVSAQGFVRVSGPDYQAFIKKISQISDQFAQSKRSFKAFSPMAYKWDKQPG